MLFQLVGQKLAQEIEEGVSSIIEAHRTIFNFGPKFLLTCVITRHSQTGSCLTRQILQEFWRHLPEKQKNEIEATLTAYVSKLPERDIIRVYSEPVGKFNSDAMLLL